MARSQLRFSPAEKSARFSHRPRLRVEQLAQEHRLHFSTQVVVRLLLEAVTEAWSEAENDAVMARLAAVQEPLARQGKIGPVARLMPTTTAVQFRTSTTAHVIDGPFAETKEQLLGFYIVDCKSLEEAIEVARSLPSVRTIFEIRPVKLFFPGGEISPILPPRAASS